jgi:putative ABC transport system permease protein
MKEKKLRSFLVFLSVALTAGLFFTSLAITDTISGINREMQRSRVGNADIRIYPGEGGKEEPFIGLSGTKDISAGTEYVIGMIDGRAIYAPSGEEMIYVDVTGTTMKDLEANNPVVFAEKASEGDFTGNRVIISRVTAEKYALTLGDTIELEFGNRPEQLQIYGIAELKGLFIAEGAGAGIIIPKDTLAGIYGLTDQVNNIYIKVKDKDKADEAIKELQDEYPDCEVGEALDASDYRQSLTEVELPLKLVTVFIILMCVFIVYTSFKIISIERMPNIGTFRSVGATKRMSGWILRLESLLYGIAGGIAGMGIGVAALWLITKVMAADISNSESVVPEFSPYYLLFTLVFAIVISYISALFPIRGIFKIPTRNLILNQTYKERKQYAAVTAAAVIMLAAAVIIPAVIPKNPMLILILDNTCVGLVLIALVLLLPVIIRLLAPLLEIFFRIFGRDGALAAKNLKNNKNILNITGLLVIGISTLIMISSINRSIVDEILNMFSKTVKFDIQLVYRDADEGFIDELREMDGITDASGAILLDALEVADSGKSINCTYGIDPERFLDHWNFDIPKATIRKLNEGRTIILGSTIMEKLGLHTGEDIRLAFQDQTQTYKIVGSFETMWENGSIGLISDRNMRSDSGHNYYTNVYVRTDRPAEEVKKELQAKYLRDMFYNITRAEELAANTEGVERVFKILRSYTGLTMLIGIVGIINNLIVSFLERRRSFAVYRSVGMSRLQLKKMILLEAISSGIIGGTVGLLAAAVMLVIMPDVMEQMMGPMEMVYSAPLFLGNFAAALAIMVSASIIPAFKSSGLSIIQTIKYE